MMGEQTICAIRASIGLALDPLYAARLGTIERHIAIEMAVGRLNHLDETLTVMQRARDGVDAGDVGDTLTHEEWERQYAAACDSREWGHCDWLLDHPPAAPDERETQEG